MEKEKLTEDERKLLEGGGLTEFLKAKKARDVRLSRIQGQEETSSQPIIAQGIMVKKSNNFVMKGSGVRVPVSAQEKITRNCLKARACYFSFVSLSVVPEIKKNPDLSSVGRSGVSFAYPEFRRKIAVFAYFTNTF